MSYGSYFQIFGDTKLDDILDAKVSDLEEEIDLKPDNYILNVNETEFINYLVGQYTIENIKILFDNALITIDEKSIRADNFPSGFNVVSGKSYPKDVIKYHIPFEGDEVLLRGTPNPHILWSMDVEIDDNCICFEIVNFYDDSDRIQRKYEENIKNIQIQLENVVKQVDDYNSNIENNIREVFIARKKHLLKKYNLVASLGVPLKRRDDVPATFAIPTPKTRKKIQLVPPTVNEKKYKTEPTLQNTDYQGILRVIQDVGKQFERMPSTYVNKHEEELRDHFLLILEPRFSGSATGETFNKSGKTDILLRYQGENVFIAECKFWKGAKAYLDTISQLLGYLTWRDSKAAVIVFVKNKEFSSVINSVESETPHHANYLGFVKKQESTWMSYRFHIDGDRNREVQLAVLLFHIPSE